MFCRTYAYPKPCKEVFQVSPIMESNDMLFHRDKFMSKQGGE